MTHTLYLDRTTGNINGLLTLQRTTPNGVVEVFKRVPLSSGQYPYTDGGAEDWVTGKGPIPFGLYWMSTKREALTSAEPKGTPFYIISTEKGSRRIVRPDGKYRENIGLHLNNAIPGSAGCPALEVDTPERECLAWALLAYLDRLHKYEPFIRVHVL